MKNFKSKPLPLRDLPLTGEVRNFKKVRESFVCGNCGFEVEGDGYTDHCPKCLWGKHVDEEIPGDRASDCQGLMKPIEVSYQAGKFKINYKCSKCRHSFWVREGENDDREKLLALMIK